jgi:DNA-binding NarL/FixJ family response regulator
MRNSFSGSATKDDHLPKVSLSSNPSSLNSNGVAINTAVATATPARSHLLVIEKRSFFRNCILDCLTNATDFSGAGYGSVEEYTRSASKTSSHLVALCAIGEGASAVTEKIAQLKLFSAPVPTVVISDSDDADMIMAAMEGGASGFITANISREVAAHALRLVAAGGQYFPVDILLSARKHDGEKSKKAVDGAKRMFTRRQIAVIDALCRGKANKIIAYELNMCESTVKVHVRNIMKKLNAKNRTEIAYLARELQHEIAGG